MTMEGAVPRPRLSVHRNHSLPRASAKEDRPSRPRRPFARSSGTVPKLASLSHQRGIEIHRNDIVTAAYSSLPPSPSHGRAVPDIRVGTPDDVEGYLSEPETEEWWPARSRRNTLDNTASPFAQSPRAVDDIGVFETARETATLDRASLWALLKDEEGAEGWEGWVLDGKWERIQNFLAVPIAVERVTLFGALLCLDGFLYNFTILPIRTFFAIRRRARKPGPMPPTHLHALLRMLLIIIPSCILLAGTDASKMYHSVRGQDTIKLYVIFNALEIADRLCCAFGQDVLDTLFARGTLTGKRRRPFFFFGLSCGYILLHSLIFLYMLISLNVAINSYDYTLLSLLISNQFVEIKGSVFKKFDKENLFQILCADIVERFQLGLMLTIISIRNVLEMSGSDISLLPKSFGRGKSLVDSVLSPVLFVILSEMIVDWLKHAFITKFNHVRASIYSRFSDVLAKDVQAATSRNHPLLLDQSPLVARRLGFAAMPLACLVVRIGVQAVGMWAAPTDEHVWWRIGRWLAGTGVTISAWGCLVALKILLGLLLLSYSAMRRAGMEKREAQEAAKAAPLGVNKEEIEYNRQMSSFLAKGDNDLVAERKKIPLEEVDRWTMVKRIW